MPLLRRIFTLLPLYPACSIVFLSSLFSMEASGVYSLEAWLSLYCYRRLIVLFSMGLGAEASVILGWSDFGWTIFFLLLVSCLGGWLAWFRDIWWNILLTVCSLCRCGSSAIVVFRAAVFAKPLSKSGIQCLILCFSPSLGSIRLGSVFAFSVISSGEKVVFSRSVFPWSWCNSTVLVFC